ncbi:MAG: metallophosphoesterase [Spongiibacter sp.]|nr:metallophosphoesterase [Spongiibacter sp.]
MTTARAAAPSELCVVQISDCHLGTSLGDCLLGMDTDHSLDEVLKLIRDNHPHIDVLVASGDLSGNAAKSAYQRLLPKLNALADRLVWLPGNHDDLGVMQQVAAPELLCSTMELDPWQLVFLNSAVPEQVGGHLAPSQLQLVRDLPGDNPSLIFVHHHLRALGSDWLDEQRIDNADELFDIIDSRDNIAAIVSGHVHQQSDTRHRSHRLLTSPSTCIQFAPNSNSFAVDELNPGYRWFTLFADGRVDTGVERVSGVRFTIDRTADGYE